MMKALKSSIVYETLPTLKNVLIYICLRIGDGFCKSYTIRYRHNHRLQNKWLYHWGVILDCYRGHRDLGGCSSHHDVSY